MQFPRSFQLTALLSLAIGLGACSDQASEQNSVSQTQRERILLDTGWQFKKYGSADEADDLIYDVRPDASDAQDDRPADAMPTEAVYVEADEPTLKPWILPTGNRFIGNSEDRHERPEGSPGQDFPFVQADFDDSGWDDVRVPHDWAIAGPFMPGDADVGGGMGRLPSPGVAWYRKSLPLTEDDQDKAIYLDVGGAMSYAMVWMNGHLVGGWPYGYASWRVDLTPYMNAGGDNQLAIRIDNPNHSARWYPGGGLFRNVWLTKTHPVHVAQWGTYVTTPEVSSERARVNLVVDIDNTSAQPVDLMVTTDIFELDEAGKKVGNPVASTSPLSLSIAAGATEATEAAVTVSDPKLWGPPPNQSPNRYMAVTRLQKDGAQIDRYETPFGIREIEFVPDRGLLVNGEHIYLQGVNQHHDLGALGAAFNVRAAERQLEILREMGVNAIRTAHNPPAQELLALTDKMGFVVMNEIFDSWERRKTPHDFHLIFPDWHEPDVRNFIRRDRNHPSVVTWSLGNEVGEQYTEEDGVAVAQRLHDIAKEEDPTRPTAMSVNYAKPPMPFPGVMDQINLNYQGEGIRNAPEYSHLEGISTEPLYPSFRKAYPDKVIISSENAAALSSRGEYLFPVTEGVSAPVEDGAGGDPESAHVSAYELYTAPFGSSADKVLGSLEQHPYVGGGFVWSGWDYLGEPTPYYSARSSYFGIIDLAGFPKDRFYLYQSHWRPDLPMVHILPHWNWPDREGEVTPVHVFTSGDEAELFLNGESLGRKRKGDYEYRLRWDHVVYEPGTLAVKAYKDGEPWADASVSTTGEAVAVQMEADRSTITADGKDLSFITVTLLDEEGRDVPTANHELTFSLDGPGKIVATDNGDPTDMVSFTSTVRSAFNGKALVIVQGNVGETGQLSVTGAAEGLEVANARLTTEAAER